MRIKKLTIVLALFFFLALASSLTLSYTFTDTDFSDGTFSNVGESSGILSLSTSQLSGSYISSILNTSSSSYWESLLWNSSAYGPLPSNGVVETSFESGNVNMTGNVLLMHFDETSGNIIDYSGNGNDGVVSGNPGYAVDGQVNQAMQFEYVESQVFIALRFWKMFCPCNFHV